MAMISEYIDFGYEAILGRCRKLLSHMDYIYIAVICLMRMGQCDELLCDDCDAKSRDDV